MKNIESLIVNCKRNSRIRDYLEEEISSGRKRGELLKLAAILHDVGKPQTFRVKDGKVQFHGHERLGARIVGDICFGLKLSNEEVRLLKKAVFLDLRPGDLATNPVLTAKLNSVFSGMAGGSGKRFKSALADERATKVIGFLIRSAKSTKE